MINSLEIELTGIASELNGNRLLTMENAQNAGEIKAQLIKKIPGLKPYFFCISVNGHFAEDSRSVSPEDRIIVFNPFAGG